MTKRDETTVPVKGIKRSDFDEAGNKRLASTGKRTKQQQIIQHQQEGGQASGFLSTNVDCELTGEHYFAEGYENLGDESRLSGGGGDGMR